MTESVTKRISPLAQVITWLERNLRIAAVRDMFSMVEVTRRELWGLMGLALAYAFTDGIGLTVLLPVLQYAEDYTISLGTGTDLLWTWPSHVAVKLGVPLSLMTLLVLAFIPVLLRQVTFYFNTWYSAIVSSRIMVRMRVDIYEKMMAADPDYLKSRPLGDFTGAVMGQTGVAGQAVILVMKMLSIVLQIVIYVTMLSFLSLPLTLLAVTAGIAVSQLLRTSLVRTREFGQEVTLISQRANAAIVERISMARLVKMRAEEDAEVQNVRTFSEDAAKAGVAISKIGANIEVTTDPLLMLSAFASLYIGIAVLGLELAELGMIIYVLTRLNSKVKEFNAVRQGLAGNVGGIFLVRDITTQAIASNTITSGPKEFGKLHDAIVLDEVSFQFPGAENPTLQGVSATIKAGSFTAIVGRSGAGKSTFVELLPRLRDVTAGAVRYDGADVREFQLSGLRRGIGYLTQDPLLFNDTVRANMLYGSREPVSDAAIEQALEQANASFVMSLPDGLDTVLGDRGIRFSGGERQRIALARVLLEDPTLLILDEPTSALDSESEGFIQQALMNLHGKTTIVVIAHRLATVVSADQLLVMESGKIVQQGTHQSLVAADGPYKHLFESQLLMR